MRGFRPATLPYVRECINVLRLHYPGRLGAACFYKVPAYFHPVWKLIKPLLDVLAPELRAKVHILGSDYEEFLRGDLDKEALEFLRADSAVISSHRALKETDELS